MPDAFEAGYARDHSASRCKVQWGEGEKKLVLGSLATMEEGETGGFYRDQLAKLGEVTRGQPTRETFVVDVAGPFAADHSAGDRAAATTADGLIG